MNVSVWLASWSPWATERGNVKAFFKWRGHYKWYGISLWCITTIHLYGPGVAFLVPILIVSLVQDLERVCHADFPMNSGPLPPPGVHNHGRRIFSRHTLEWRRLKGAEGHGRWRSSTSAYHVIPILLSGLSKGVGFIRFDQRIEAERAIQELNGTIPKGSTEPITVKFANNPSNNNKAIPPLAAYLAPQARRFGGPIHHPTGRFRYIPLSPLSRYLTFPVAVYF